MDWAPRTPGDAGAQPATPASRVTNQGEYEVGRAKMSWGKIGQFTARVTRRGPVGHQNILSYTPKYPRMLK